MDQKNKDKIIQELLEALVELADYYGVPEDTVDRIPERLKARAQFITSVTSVEDIERHVLQIKDSMFVHCLSMWSKGKASGPSNPTNLEARAKKKDSLADWLDKQGKQEYANKQRKLANELRDQAAILRKESGELQEVKPTERLTPIGESNVPKDEDKQIRRAVRGRPRKRKDV